MIVTLSEPTMFAVTPMVPLPVAWAFASPLKAIAESAVVRKILFFIVIWLCFPVPRALIAAQRRNNRIIPKAGVREFRCHASVTRGRENRERADAGGQQSAWTISR